MRYTKVEFSPKQFKKSDYGNCNHSKGLNLVCRIIDKDREFYKEVSIKFLRNESVSDLMKRYEYYGERIYDSKYEALEIMRAINTMALIDFKIDLDDLAENQYVSLRENTENNELYVDILDYLEELQMED